MHMPERPTNSLFIFQLQLQPSWGRQRQASAHQPTPEKKWGFRTKIWILTFHQVIQAADTTTVFSSSPSTSSRWENWAFACLLHQSCPSFPLAGFQATDADLLMPLVVYFYYWTSVFLSLANNCICCTNLLAFLDVLPSLRSLEPLHKTSESWLRSPQNFDPRALSKVTKVSKAGLPENLGTPSFFRDPSLV